MKNVFVSNRQKPSFLKAAIKKPLSTKSKTAENPLLQNFSQSIPIYQ